MLTKGIGRFSKVLEASEIRAAVMDFAIEFRVLQVEEIEASSVGSSHGKMRWAQWYRDASILQTFSFIAN